MEIYRENSSVVIFPVPIEAEQVTATVTRGDYTSGPLNVTREGNEGKVTIPYSVTRYDGIASVNVSMRITGNSYARTFNYDVVTPLVSINKVVKDLSVSESDAKELERSVRQIVKVHTQQTFGFFVGRYKVAGRGESSLELPHRLVKLGGVYENGLELGLTDYRVSSDGWYLKRYQGFGTDSFGIIHVTESNLFRNDIYEIDGQWGYTDVPDDINEAAHLLIKDYSCDEGYRDRYLNAMKSADWSLQYNPGAFRGTGNVRADQLLAQYVKQSMMLV